VKLEVHHHDGDERPYFGPPCPGPDVHAWTIVGEGDGALSIQSGCPDCDLWYDMESLLAEIRGRLTLEHDHDATGGRCPNALRMLPCDCNFWWRFTPEPTS
jgi:hypothetical protein